MYIIIYWVGVIIIFRLLIRDKIILHASTCIHILNRLYFFRYDPTCHSLIDGDKCLIEFFFGTLNTC